MKDYKIKLKEIFFPYLTISFGTILIYNLARWVLDIKLGLIPLKEDVLNYWIPVSITALLVYFGLSKRIKLLKVSYNIYSLYQFVMIAMIITPLLISQYYLEKALFDLIQISSTSEIYKYPKEKYFELTNFRVNKDNCVSNSIAKTTGRSNDRLTFEIHFACPFKEDQSIWCGINYYQSLSNRINKREKNLMYDDFIRESKVKFNRYNYKEATYFEKLNNSNERNDYLKAIKKSNTYDYPTILSLKTDKFDERLGSTLAWFIGSLFIGSIIILCLILFPEIDKKKLK